MNPETHKKRSRSARESFRRITVQAGVSRFSSIQFLVALSVLLIADPFVEQIHYGRFIESALLTTVLLSAVLAIGASKHTLIWAVVLVIPAILGRWANYAWSSHIAPEAGLVPGLIFIGFVIFHLMRFVLRAPRVDSEVLCAGVATYLLLGLIWSFAYLLVSRLAPGSFDFTAGPIPSRSMVGFTGLYFSFVTLSTVGYGDIVPVLPAARLLAMMEAMTGTLFMAVFISRLVAVYSSAKPAGEQETPEEKDNQP